MWLLDHQRPLASGSGDNPPAISPVPEPSRARQRRGAVREMLTALEHATFAGQHHLMRKVLHVLDEEATSSQPWLGEAQRRAITGCLTALAHEVSRIAPDGRSFARHALQIVDALSGAM